MDISEEAEVEHRGDGSIVVSSKRRLVEAPDGSKHLMPVVNVAALAEASKRSNISGQAKDKDATECIGRPLNEENVSRS